MLAYLWSDRFLSRRGLLYALFWINFLGTIYGYFWYGNQLVWTVREKSVWLLPFVPDSPTASLFFTISILLLLAGGNDLERRAGLKPRSFIRALVEVFAAVTSVKYGVWAVAMILAGYAQGDEVSWEEIMLIISHSGMALEALLYLRFFAFGLRHLLIVSAWVLLNDGADYALGVFPWLPEELLDDLDVIPWFTAALSVASVLVVWICAKNDWRR
jgi:uncharacterized membrane protein YpjA